MGHASCTHSGVHAFMVKTYNVSSREINLVTPADLAPLVAAPGGAMLVSHSADPSNT